jgi:hypothetical protein
MMSRRSKGTLSIATMSAVSPDRDARTLRVETPVVSSSASSGEPTVRLAPVRGHSHSVSVQRVSGGVEDRNRGPLGQSKTKLIDSQLRGAARHRKRRVVGGLAEIKCDVVVSPGLDESMMIRPDGAPSVLGRIRTVPLAWLVA